MGDDETERLRRIYRRVTPVHYGKRREAMVIKHRSSDPEPEKADDCPFDACRTKPRKIALLVIEHDDESADRGKRWVYCKNCGAAGPQADSNTDAVKLWNVRRPS